MRACHPTVCLLSLERLSSSDHFLVAVLVLYTRENGLVMSHCLVGPIVLSKLLTCTAFPTLLSSKVQERHLKATSPIHDPFYVSLTKLAISST